MNVVRIRGTREQLLALATVEDLILARHSTRPVGDLWEISAHATDEAIAAVTATGCTVEVDKSSEEEEELYASLYEDIEPDDGIA